MDKDKEKKLFNALEKSIRDVEAINGKIPFPVNPFDENDQLNPSVAISVLRDPQYQEWRDQNPGDVVAIQKALKSYGIEQGLRALPTAVKGAIGLDQMAKSRRIDTTPPQYPNELPRNRALQRFLFQAEQRAFRGMSPAQLDMARRQNELSERQMFQRSVEGFGGQGGAAAAQYQAGANRVGAFASRLADFNEQVRDRGLSEFARGTQMQMQEDQNRQAFRQDRFNMRDMPLWQQRVLERSQLIGAGLRNAIGSMDALSNQARDFNADFFTGGRNINNNVYPGSKQVSDAAAKSEQLLKGIRSQRFNIPEDDFSGQVPDAFGVKQPTSFNENAFRGALYPNKF